MKGKQRVVTCGKCKKTFPQGKGHNKRTCGKTLHKNPLPLSRSGTSTKSSLSGGKVVTTPPQPPIISTSPAVSSVITSATTSQPSDRYSIEEVETLWELLSGKYGEHSNGSSNFMATGWDGEDMKLLKEIICVEAFNPSSTITAGQWKTFLEKFSLNVRLTLIASFHTVQGQKCHSGGVMPEKIVEAFMLEKNDFILARLIELHYVPEKFINKVLNSASPSLFVLTSIARNRTVSGTVLEKVENRLEYFNIDRESGQASVDRVRKAIAEHPHITRGIQQKYINIYGTDVSHYNQVYANLLSNPQLDSNNIEKPFNELMKTVESSVPHDYTPSSEGGTGVVLSPAAKYLQKLAQNPQLPPELFKRYLTPTLHSAEFYEISPKHYSNPKIDSTTCVKFAEILLNIGNITKLKYLLNNPNADRETFTMVVDKLHNQPLSAGQNKIYNIAYNKLYHQPKQMMNSEKN